MQFTGFNSLKRNRGELSAWLLKAQFIGVLMTMTGLFHSRALASAGVAVLFLGALARFSFQNERSTQLRINPATIWIAYFGVYLAAATFSGFSKVWLDTLRVKLPLLLVPLALIFSPLPRRLIRAAILVFCCSISAIAAATLANYFRYYDEFQTALAKSQPVPVIAFDLQNSHIYFAIALAFSSLACLYLAWDKTFRIRREGKSALLLLGLFQVVALHVVGARTGLGAFYTGLLFGALYIGLQRKKYLLTAGIIFFALSGPMVALSLSPALRHRAESAQKDLRSYADDDWITFSSIARRLAAWEIGMKVFMEQPFTGAGPHKGERSAQMDKYYEKESYVLLKEMRLYNLHNQYFEEFVTLGVLNGVFFLFLLAYPFLSYGLKLELLFVIFFGVTASVMVAESVLERQTGILIFGLFWHLLFAKEKD